MSAVTTLFTSMVCIMSDGMRSSCTLRVSPSADGRRLPLTVTEVRSALVPRTCPKRASPWSYCTLMPLMRLSASPMFESGNFPTWSADTTLVRPMPLFCIWRARRWPVKAPCTSISLRAWPSLMTKSFTCDFLSVTVIFFVMGA